MVNPAIAHKETLLNTHQQRLSLLEIRAAKQGYNTDPDILLEIQEIQATMKYLQEDIENLTALSGLERQLSGILDTQGITTRSITNGISIDHLRTEIKQTIEAVLRDILQSEQRLPSTKAPPEVPISFYLEIANGLAISGHWLKAAEYYTEYITYSPDNWEVHYARGVAYQNTYGNESINLFGLRSYNEAIALAPRELDLNMRARLYTYRGAVFKRLRRLQEAEHDFNLAEKWATRNKEIEDLYYNKACIYAMTSRKQDMLVSLQSLIAQNPEWKEVIRSKPEYFNRYWNDQDFNNLLI